MSTQGLHGTDDQVVVLGRGQESGSSGSFPNTPLCLFCVLLLKLVAFGLIVRGFRHTQHHHFQPEVRPSRKAGNNRYIVVEFAIRRFSNVTTSSD